MGICISNAAAGIGYLVFIPLGEDVDPVGALKCEY